ncbi:MAG TPA: recombinase family protein [Armatimonadota bacterium]|jgi:site-specific DNA recombinase
MTAAIYIRVSTVEQERHGYSLDAQMARCQEEATRLGYNVPPEHVYQDVETAKTGQERPELDRMLRSALDGSVQAVLFVAWDRLSRSVYDMAAMVRLFEKAHVTAIAVAEPLDLSTPQGEAMLHVRAAFAQLELRLISQRVKAAHREIYDQGKWPGGTVPYGWSLEDGRPVRNPVRIAILRRIFDMYSAGVSTRRIAEILSAEGVPTVRGGEVWHMNVVRKILNHPAYRGALPWGSRGVLEWKWGSTLPMELVQQVDLRLSVNRKVQGPHGTFFPWQGLLVCGRCGEGFHRVNMKRSCGTYAYVRCNGVAYPNEGVRCRAPMLRVDALEEITRRVVHATSTAQPVVRPVSHDAPSAERISEIQTAKARETVIYRAGQMTSEEYIQIIRTLDAELALIDAPVSGLTPEFARNLKAAWPGLSIGEKNSALRLLCMRLTVHGRYLVADLHNPGWDNWLKHVITVRPKAKTHL